MLNEQANQDFKLAVTRTAGQTARPLAVYYQFGFWLLICAISFVTLTLWYGQLEWQYFVHVLVQGLIGVGLTSAMEKPFIAIWHWQIKKRLLLGLALVLFVALVWTIARMIAFTEITSESDIWWNFGGWYFSGIFIVMCWSAIFHVLIYYQVLQAEHRTLITTQAQNREEHIKRVEAQAIAKDAKLKMLRYQLNPHFLSNTLNAVNALIEMESHQQAQKMVVNLSKFLRYSLDNDPQMKVTLKQEVHALELYLEIEKVRFGERLTFSVDIEEQAKPALIPSLLLQPIVENSMKHVIAKNEDGGTISIHAHLVSHKLHIQLSDSGTDPQAEPCLTTQDKRGIGLRNIQQRLAALFPAQHQFSFEFQPQGNLITTIEIPYESDLP